MKKATTEINDLVARLRVLSNDEEGAREYEKYQAQEARRRLSDVLVADGIPKRIRAGLEASQPTQAIRAVESWQGSRSWCLCLSGGVGVGKSFAAGWWLKKWAEEMVREPSPRAKRRWFSAVRLATMSQYGDEFEQLGNLPTLVIDDLGIEYNDTKGNFLSKLDYLLDCRYAEERPTIITTNLGPDAFKSRYGARLVDRIREGGSFRVVAGGSLRGR